MYEYFLGIDLHKRSSTWVTVDQQRSVTARQVVPVNPTAIRHAIVALSIPVGSIKATLEPVCGWRWVQQLLIEHGIDTVLANPTKVRLIAASKHKTDTNDARMLAELLASGYLPEAYRAPANIVEIRNLVRERHYLVSVRTGFKNRLKGVVTARGEPDILETCLTTTGRQYIEAHDLTELRDLSELISELSQYIKRLESELKVALKDNQLAQLLETAPTMGPISVATVVAEVGDMTRFASAKKLANYAGLVPGQRSSGARLRYGRITKVGQSTCDTRWWNVRCACVSTTIPRCMRGMSE